MIDLAKAEEVLQDLESQLKNAEQQVILLQGAVQGCKVTIEALKEVNKPIEEVSPKKTNLKKVK